MILPRAHHVALAIAAREDRALDPGHELLQVTATGRVARHLRWCMKYMLATPYVILIFMLKSMFCLNPPFPQIHSESTVQDYHSEICPSEAGRARKAAASFGPPIRFWCSSKVLTVNKCWC